MSSGFAKAWGFKRADCKKMTKFGYDQFRYNIETKADLICPVCGDKLSVERCEAAHIIARCHFGDQVMTKPARCAVHYSCNRAMTDKPLQVNTSDPRIYVQHLE